MIDEYQWLSDDEQAFWQLLVGTYRGVERNIDRALRDHLGLSFGDFTILIALNETSDGVMTDRELANRLKWTQTRVITHTERMEKRGVISIENQDTVADAHQHEGTGFNVVLTGLGRKTFADLAPTYVEQVRKLVFDQVDREQITMLADSLRRILASAEKQQ